MRTTRALLMLVAALELGVVSGCMRSTDRDHLNQLQGRWLWLGSSGGRARETIGPGTEEIVMTIGRDGSYRETRSGSAETVGRWLLLVDTAGEAQVSQSIVEFQPPLHVLHEAPRFRASLRGDTLLLMTTEYDGFSHRFLRQREAPR